MDGENRPHRRFSVEIKIHGDTREDVLVLLREYVTSIAAGHTFNLHAGYSSGGNFLLHEDPEMTHDRFVEENERYCESRRMTYQNVETGERFTGDTPPEWEGRTGTISYQNGAIQIAPQDFEALKAE